MNLKLAAAISLFLALCFGWLAKFLYELSD